MTIQLEQNRENTQKPVEEDVRGVTARLFYKRIAQRSLVYLARAKLPRVAKVQFLWGRGGRQELVMYSAMIIILQKKKLNIQW